MTLLRDSLLPLAIVLMYYDCPARYPRLLTSQVKPTAGRFAPNSECNQDRHNRIGCAASKTLACDIVPPYLDNCRRRQKKEYMEDAYEEVVRWYLRFNGYLCVENFIIHEPAPSAETIPQGAEVDTLAVRFPFSREVIVGTPKKEVVRDVRLKAPQPENIDCVVAEIKGGERIRLNSIWRDHSEQTRKRVEYIVRWFGCMQDEEVVSRISSDLQRNFYADHAGCSFRVLLFAKRRTPQNLPSGITVITFEDVMRFFVTSRANCWLDLGIGTRSRHPQWSDLVNELWTLAGPETSADVHSKVEQMIAVLDRTHTYRSTEARMCTIVHKLTTSPLCPFDDKLRSALPSEHGLYIIYDCSGEAPVSIRAGRTKSATGGLRQRIYSNHFMGDQKGNLRQQLVSDGVCSDLESAKTWLRDRCRVRFVTITDDADRRWSEHYMLSVVRPRYCD